MQTDQSELKKLSVKVLDFNHEYTLAQDQYSLLFLLAIHLCIEILMPERVGTAMFKKIPLKYHGLFRIYSIGVGW